MAVPHLKGGKIIWTCVEDGIIELKEGYQKIGLVRFDYKLFEEEEGGGVRESINEYPYLTQLLKMNEDVGENY